MKYQEEKKNWQTSSSNRRRFELLGLHQCGVAKMKKKNNLQMALATGGNDHL